MISFLKACLLLFNCFSDLNISKLPTRGVKSPCSMFGRWHHVIYQFHFFFQWSLSCNPCTCPPLDQLLPGYCGPVTLECPVTIILWLHPVPLLYWTTCFLIDFLDSLSHFEGAHPPLAFEKESTGSTLRLHKYENIIILPSHLVDGFTGYRSLGLNHFPLEF